MNAFCQSGSLAGMRILLIEDEYMLADMVRECLEAAGAAVRGPIGQLADAVDFVSRAEEPFDIAVLDVDLHGEKTYPVAELLEGYGIPFVFVTGYSDDVFDRRFRGHAKCEKPFRPGELIAALMAPNRR